MEPAEPEFLEAGGHLFVTLDLPDIPQGQLAHYVGTNLLVLWRRDTGQEQSRMIRLPVDVDPGRAVLRVNNGVLDLEVPVVQAGSSSSQSEPVVDGSA
jgi:HSP20 family molecular chaperone IbpA